VNSEGREAALGQKVDGHKVRMRYWRERLPDVENVKESSLTRVDDPGRPGYYQSGKSEG
jgi:hypothetical protein